MSRNKSAVSSCIVFFSIVAACCHRLRLFCFAVNFLVLPIDHSTNQFIYYHVLTVDVTTTLHTETITVPIQRAILTQYLLGCDFTHSTAINCAVDCTPIPLGAT